MAGKLALSFPSFSLHSASATSVLAFPSSLDPIAYTSLYRPPSSPVSLKSPSEYLSRLLQLPLHVFNSSSAFRQSHIASTDHSTLASALDLIHPYSISIHFLRLLRDLPLRLWGESGRLTKALIFPNPHVRPTTVA